MEEVREDKTMRFQSRREQSFIIISLFSILSAIHDLSTYLGHLKCHTNIESTKYPQHYMLFTILQNMVHRESLSQYYLEIRKRKVKFKHEMNIYSGSWSKVCVKILYAFQELLPTPKQSKGWDQLRFVGPIQMSHWLSLHKCLTLSSF